MCSGAGVVGLSTTGGVLLCAAPCERSANDTLLPILRRGPAEALSFSSLRKSVFLAMVAIVCGSANVRTVATSKSARWSPLPSVKPGYGVAPRIGVSRGRTVVVNNKAEEVDFDALLIKVADEFDKLDNKPVVIGYGVAALLSLFFVEWLIHLPGLNFLIGFPVQLLGVLIAPYLAIRYGLDKEDWYGDIEGFLKRLAELLPGLKKE